MASLRPGETYELASFPVSPGHGDPPRFEVRLNARGVREREFSSHPEPGVTRVIAIGDSTTFGTGVSPAARFTEVLQERLNRAQGEQFEVLNCGKAGMTAEDGLKFYETQVRGWSPNVIIAGLGTNNLRDGRNPMQVANDPNVLNAYQTSLESLARRTAQDGVALVLWANVVLDNRGENSLRPFNARMAAVAEKYALPLVDLETIYAKGFATEVEQARFDKDHPWTAYWPQFARVPKRKAALHNDMAHPNQAGFARLADALLPFVLHARERGLSP